MTITCPLCDQDSRNDDPWPELPCYVLCTSCGLWFLAETEDKFRALSDAELVEMRERKQWPRMQQFRWLALLERMDRDFEFNLNVVVALLNCARQRTG